MIDNNFFFDLCEKVTKFILQIFITNLNTVFFIIFKQLYFFKYPLHRNFIEFVTLSINDNEVLTEK